MDIRLAGKDDVLALTTLWDEAFGDPAEYMDDFFGAFFTPDYSAPALFDADGVVCALHLLEFDTYADDMSATDGKSAGKSGYIYAAATHKARRGEGHMSRLMEYTVSLAKRRGYTMLFLVPEDKALFDFYSRLGFIPTFYKHTAEIKYSTAHTVLRDMDICDDVVWNRYYSAYTDKQRDYPLSPVKDEEFFNFTMSEYFAADGLIDEVVGNGELRGWILYSKEKSHLIIHDFIPAADDITMKDFRIEGYDRVSLTGGKALMEGLGLETQAVPFGMALPLDKESGQVLEQSKCGCYISFFGD